MKLLSSWLVFVILFNSCKVPEKENVIEQRLIANKKIDSLLTAFVKENKSTQAIYELYIDKIDPHNYQLIIYSGKNSLTQDENNDLNQKTFSYAVVSGIRFNIYSGVEHYFNNSKPLQKDKMMIIDTSAAINKIEDKIWSVRDSFGVLITSKQIFAYPFMPLPRNGENVRMLKRPK